MSYSKTNWQNSPSTSTPLSATNLNKMENGIADAVNAIGVNAYDSTSTYAVGDFCIYNNTLYRCTTAITTAEAWNSSKWTATNIISGIVERGTNVNGFWTKFSDGTMICSDHEKVTDQTINNAYGSLYQGTRTLTFPQQFTSAPEVSCGQFQYGTGASWGTVSSISSTQVTLRVFDIVSRSGGDNCLISYIAIGRWK